MLSTTKKHQLMTGRFKNRLLMKYNELKLNYLSNIAIAINQSVEKDSLTVSFHNMSFISITADVVRTYGKALCRCLLKTK